jgi:hypothetical protein
MDSKLFKSGSKGPARHERLEGIDWLPPVIEIGDERYRLERLTPLYWEDYV